MKKTSIRFMAVASVLALSLTACNKSQPQQDAKSDPVSSTGKGMKIAYVEVDSIMTQYQFAKDYGAELQKKGNNIQSTLANKQKQLSSAAQNFQQKVQQNAYTREQAEGIQANLARQGQDLQVLGQRLQNEFQAETDKYNQALHDSISHFLEAYNKDKKYDLILSKAGDNLLYADKKHDITKEVVAGLNKAYKPVKKEAGKTGKK